MRVLLLVHGLPVGGTEMMVCHLARRLRDEGVGVEIGCLDEVGDLGRALEEEGFQVELYGRRPGLDVTLPRRIARHARRAGCDLVHAHQYTCFFYAALARLLLRRPIVFTEHGRFYPDIAGARRRAFNFLFARMADRMTAVSRGVRESLRRVEGFDAERIEVIYNGIDVERFAEKVSILRPGARERLGLRAGTRVVGTVGRLDPIKNQALLLRSFALLGSEAEETVLAIVGDGPEREKLEALARSLGVASRTRFLGQRRDLEAILAAFDVFALSSFSEGTPMTIIEAMAASIPIVSTGVGGIPEVIEDGREGILVPGTPPADGGSGPGEEYVRLYASALRRALEDPASAGARAACALDRARRDFSLEGICERYLEVYRKAAPRAGWLRPAGVRR